MFNRIMVPVDLEHVDQLGKALDTAVHLAKEDDATLFFVAISTETPGAAASTPEEFEQVLKQFADEQSRKYGLPIETRSLFSVDVARELHKRLLELADELEADLIVMASHVPGIGDKLHLIGSHAGSIATHFSRSVFVVR